MKPPILEVRAEEVREVTAALEQGRCVAVLSPEVSGSTSVLQLAVDFLREQSDTFLVVHLSLPRGSQLPLDDFFRSVLRHLLRRLKSRAPELDLKRLLTELYGDVNQTLLPDSHSSALHFEEVLAVLVDELLIPNGRRLVLAVDHLGRVSLDHLREFGNIVHRLWEELDGHLVLLTAGAEPLYTLCRRGSRDGHFSAFHIAHRVELKDLTLSRTAAFVAARLEEKGRHLDEALHGEFVERVFALTAGHPYFIDQLLEQLETLGAREIASSALGEIGALLLSDSPYLELCRERLLREGKDKQLRQELERLRQAVEGPAPRYTERDAALETLRWQGLVTVRHGVWCPRNWLVQRFALEVLSVSAPEQARDAGLDATRDLAGNDTLEQAAPPLFDGRYQLWRPLSSGAFGIIFEARDTLLGAKVALKRLHQHLSSERNLERFRREVLIARRLTHPNIIRVHDLGKADGSFYYTMEYVSGGNLADRLAELRGEGRMGLLPLMVQLCEGLEALHKAGIVHRDLKPENALIDAKGMLKLADFGISKAGDLTGLTGAGAIGTPLYMSPEQAGNLEVTRASDIYAVGVLLYELFVGETPFRSDDVHELIALQQTKIPEPVGSRSEFVPEEVAALIDSALSKDPSERPASARAIADVLSQYV